MNAFRATAASIADRTGTGGAVGHTSAVIGSNFACRSS